VARGEVGDALVDAGDPDPRRLLGVEAGLDVEQELRVLVAALDRGLLAGGLGSGLCGVLAGDEKEGGENEADGGSLHGARSLARGRRCASGE